MRKMMCILLAALMVISMAGCSDKKNTETGTESQTSQAAEGAAAEGQNPAMNIVGKYGCDKATLTVEAVDSTTTRMTVYWPTSSLTRTEWTMTGTFNPEKQTIEYSDGTKKAFTFDEKGKLKKETVDYENGTGRFKIDMAASEITWEDDQEKAGEGLTFKLNQITAPAMEVTENSDNSAKQEESKAPAQESSAAASESGKKENSENSKSENSQNSQNSQNESKPSENKKEESSKNAETNDSDITGTYGIGRASMDIYSLGDGYYEAVVTWFSSAAEYTEWVMSGWYDEENGVLEYDDCTKTDCGLDEDGDLAYEETIYEDGTGRIWFDTKNDTISWEDDQEDIAGGNVFYEAEEPQEESGEKPENSEEETEYSEALDYAGYYYADKASMEVTYEGDNVFSVVVVWSTSNGEHSEWYMSGVFNPETLVMEYDDCTRIDYELDEDGDVVSSETIYDGGTGRLVFDSRDYTIYWQDDVEDIASELLFE